jgi:hypothetical protein
MNTQINKSYLPSEPNGIAWSKNSNRTIYVGIPTAYDDTLIYDQQPAQEGRVCLGVPIKVPIAFELPRNVAEVIQINDQAAILNASV